MKLYRTNIKLINPKLIKEWNIGGRPVHKVEGVEYMPPKQMGGSKMYKMPVSVIEEGWKKDKDFYFGMGTEGVIGRREKFREWRKKKIPIEVPEIYIDENKTVYFFNGRHRFAELRDEGKTEIAIAISNDSNQEALREMGAIPM